MRRIFLLLLLPLAASPARGAERVLFQDDFARADSASPGPGWTEWSLRRAPSGSYPAPSRADTPWGVKGGALAFDLVGSNSYVEDFLETAAEYPVEGTRVEWELRSVTGTRAGYVGPVFAWLDTGARRTGAANLSPGPNFIGLHTWYRWENQGTAGVLVLPGGPPGRFVDHAAVALAGANAPSFARHSLTVQGGRLVWEAQGRPTLSVPLAEPLPAGARRRFLVGIRLYDAGLRQAVEVKRFRIVALDGAGTTTAGPAPDGEGVDATFGGRAVKLAGAWAATGPAGDGTDRTFVEAAPSASALAADANRLTVSFKGGAPGPYLGAAAMVTFALSPEEFWLPTDDLGVVVGRLDGPGGLCEGLFVGTFEHWRGERKLGLEVGRGNFKARVKP